MAQLTPCLWFFAGDAMEAFTRYVEVFSRYGEARILSDGDIVVEVDLDGQRVQGINGGPAGFVHSPAFSMSVLCEGSEQVDHYWDSLVEGGEPGNCGWLVDRWGISWQIVPRELMTLMGDPDPAKAAAARDAMLQMSKIDVEALRAAHAGA
ncbi:MAG TPA: VOC family protein [Candidatus Nanopelagicales bacterium]|nr:VOC family protein [Candidatus Nanopelagicales bacterium]